MMRSSWLTLAYAMLLAAAGPLAACASNGAEAQDAPAQQAQSAQPQASQAQPSQTQGSGYTDAQLRSFVAARDAIQELSPGQTTEQQAANQQQIAQILQQNNLSAEQYNAIAAASQTDVDLRNRIAAVSVGTTFTDAQLRSFAAASVEIDPINAELATATEAERQVAAAQIREILERNDLDFETYNGIATRAQSDQALAQRIAQFQAEARAEE